MDIETYQDKVINSLAKLGIESDKLDNIVKWGMNGWQIIGTGFERGQTPNQTAKYIAENITE
jgi:hypothetical protein